MTDLHGAGNHVPFDEAGLWATDALLDAIAAGVPVEDDPAAALLSALVADLSPAPATVALPKQRRPRRRLAPRTGIAGIAVLGVLSTGGVAAASVNAGPTSPLFPLHQVLTGGPQLDGSQRQALEVKRKLQSAAKALAAGKVDRAARDVDAAQGRLPKVKPADGRGALAQQVSVLNRQVSAGAAPVVTTMPPTKAPRSTVAAPRTTPAAGHTTPPARPTSGPATTTPPTTPTSSVPVVVGPTSTAPTPAPTSPVPTSTTPAPSTPGSPSASPSAGSSTTGPSSTTPVVVKTHKPGGGKGGTGGSPAPGSPPATSHVPPSAAPSTAPTTAPVTVPPAVVTVPPASATPTP